MYDSDSVSTPTRYGVYLAVMREYDPSRASVVNLLVTPEIFARAVVIEKQYRDLSHTHLRGMVNAVIFREDGDPAAFLQQPGGDREAEASGRPGDDRHPVDQPPTRPAHWTGVAFTSFHRFVRMVKSSGAVSQASRPA